MKQTEYWNEFISTGKVEDYLLYCKAKMNEENNFTGYLENEFDKSCKSDCINEKMSLTDRLPHMEKRTIENAELSDGKRNGS